MISTPVPVLLEGSEVCPAKSKAVVVETPHPPQHPHFGELSRMKLSFGRLKVVWLFTYIWLNHLLPCGT